MMAASNVLFVSLGSAAASGKAENPDGRQALFCYSDAPCKGLRGGRRETCLSHSLAAPLPFSVAPHHAGVGCAMSSTGTGFADVRWGIPALWTLLPKSCKSLTQLQGGRQAAICDSHVHAQQGGGQGAAAPPFRPLSSHLC